MTEVERGSGLGSYIKAILYNPTKAATFFFNNTYWFNEHGEVGTSLRKTGKLRE